MSVRSTHLTIVGAAGAALLTVTALAAPALAASTADAAYTCTTPAGDAHPTASYSVATAPTTMSVGQPLATTADFTLDAFTTSLATGTLKWVKFNGTITTAPSASQAGLSLTIPKTTLGNGTAGSTVAHTTGSTLAGSALSSSFTFVLGDLGKVVLNGFDASGKKLGTVVFPTTGSFGKCTNDVPTGTTLMDGVTPVTTKVVADKTTTAEKAKYAAKAKTATGTATVKSRYGFIVPTGKVTFILKKGTKTIAKAKVSLKKGVAKHVFKGVKAKGKYSITGKYAGSTTMKSSSGKATFKVS